MVQTLDCIFFCAWKNKAESGRIEKCLASGESCEIIVDRHRLSFDAETQMVTIQRASEDVPFACKIWPCRMPYAVLERLLKHDLDHMEGFEWL
ncbi:MAG: hypothetical protein IK083_06295 [Abditibacteriota bacterium]|nr:hypothetical protein [Abditibacteriota bacterium]